MSKKKDLNPPWNVAYESSGETVVASRSDGSIVARIDARDVPSKWTQQKLAFIISAAPDFYEMGSDLISIHNKRYARSGGFCGCEQCQRIETILNKAEGKI